MSFSKIPENHWLHRCLSRGSSTLPASAWNFFQKVIKLQSEVAVVPDSGNWELARLNLKELWSKLNRLKNKVEVEKENKTIKKYSELLTFSILKCSKSHLKAIQLQIVIHTEKRLVTEKKINEYWASIKQNIGQALQIIKYIMECLIEDGIEPDPDRNKDLFRLLLLLEKDYDAMEKEANDMGYFFYLKPSLSPNNYEIGKWLCDTLSQVIQNIQKKKFYKEYKNEYILDILTGINDESKVKEISFPASSSSFLHCSKGMVSIVTSMPQIEIDKARIVSEVTRYAIVDSSYVTRFVINNYGLVDRYFPSQEEINQYSYEEIMDLDVFLDKEQFKGKLKIPKKVSENISCGTRLSYKSNKQARGFLSQAGKDSIKDKNNPYCFALVATD